MYRRLFFFSGQYGLASIDCIARTYFDFISFWKIKVNPGPKLDQSYPLTTFQFIFQLCPTDNPPGDKA
jgi:hypothetical protein